MGSQRLLARRCDDARTCHTTKMKHLHASLERLKDYVSHGKDFLLLESLRDKPADMVSKWQSDYGVRTHCRLIGKPSSRLGSSIRCQLGLHLSI